MFVFDFDNFDGALSADDIRHAKQAGMQGAIVGLQYPSDGSGIAHQQLEVLIQAGVPIVACYAESQFIGDVWGNVSRFAPQIPQIYQACEEPFVDRAYIDRGLDFIDALNLGKRAGIYTGAWFWAGKEFEHWFGDRDLWIAQYDSSPDPDNYQPVGDWTRCTIKQWNGNARVGRMNLDINVTRDW